MKNKKFFAILGAEVLVVSVVALLFFFDTTDIYRFFVGDTKFAEQNKNCDLHEGSCAVTLLDGKEMLFDVTPKSIPLMKPLTFSVEVSEPLDKETLDLAIYATNMNMGYHTFSMKKVSDTSYKASGILPTCVVGNMIWRAEVSIDNPTQSYGGAFTFQTE